MIKQNKIGVAKLCFAFFVALGLRLGFSANTDCGPQCVMHVLMLEGRAATYDEVKKSIFLTSKGSSLLDLKKSLALYDLHSVGAKIDWNQRRESGNFAPLIVHLKGDHFAVIDAFRDGVYRIWYPPGISATIDATRLAAISSGNSLIVEDTYNTDVPRIAFSKAEVVFERVVVGVPSSSDIQVYNLGSEFLALRKTAASCSCVSATIKQNTIEPGGSAGLRISLKPESNQGTVEIVLVSNDSSNRNAILIVKWGKTSNTLKSRAEKLDTSKVF